jgi:hypothetical protein
VCRGGGVSKRGRKFKFWYYADEQESKKKQYRKKGDGRVRTMEMKKVGGAGKGGWGV